MLFITHLIVNERKCNQQLLSTLHGTKETAESRANTSTDGAQDILVPPTLGHREGESCKCDQCRGHKSTAASGWSLASKARAGNKMHSTLASVTLSSDPSTSC